MKELFLLFLLVAISNGQVIVSNTYTYGNCSGDIQLTTLYGLNICFSQQIRVLDLANNRFTLNTYSDVGCTSLTTSQNFTFNCSNNLEVVYVDDYQFPTDTYINGAWVFNTQCTSTLPVPGPMSSLVWADISFTQMCLDPTQNGTYSYYICKNSHLIEYVYGPNPPPTTASGITGTSGPSSSATAGTSSGASAENARSSGTGIAGTVSSGVSGSGTASSSQPTTASFTGSSVDNACPGYFLGGEEGGTGFIVCGGSVYYGDACN